jgi:hypothetical protein
MPGPKKSASTGFRPIFVASGQGGDYAAEFSLKALELILGKEKMDLPDSVEGDISGWIKELFTKSDQFQQRAIRENDPTAVQREVMREAATVTADSRDRNEMDLAAVLGGVSPEDMQLLAVAIQTGDVTTMNKVRTEVGERVDQKLGSKISPKVVKTFFALAARSRAARAADLCMTLYKINPLSLIAAAENGDREAALKLVKVDKLFLTDGCTAAAIRSAELQQDYGFLKQLARAITYVPKIGWRHGWAFGVEGGADC